MFVLRFCSTSSFVTFSFQLTLPRLPFYKKNMCFFKLLHLTSQLLAAIGANLVGPRGGGSAAAMCDYNWAFFKCQTKHMYSIHTMSTGVEPLYENFKVSLFSIGLFSCVGPAMIIVLK